MASEVNNIFVIAHEIKEPLSLMRQLALSLDFADEKQLKDAKSKMISVSERAIRQVNDLTKILSLENGLFDLEPISVRAICDEIVTELRFLYRQNHRQLAKKYTNKSKLVIANREMLYSIIYNFCSNAMHYSEDDTQAILSVRDLKEHIEIEVRDFGPALPLKTWRELKKGWINEPTAIAMRPGSSGLGLYISSRFSKYMNAKISATRHRDGTSFKLILPVSCQLSIFGD